MAAWTGTRPYDPDQGTSRHLLSAFPALAPRRTVLTGLLDRSALYGAIAEIEALGLDLLELRKLTPDRESRSGH